jgi:antitoxin YefM
MRTMPLSEAKAKLSKIIDSVRRLDDEVMITKNGRAAAVLLSPDEYDSWHETKVIKNDKEFIKEIKHALKKIDKNARLYSLEELFK